MGNIGKEARHLINRNRPNNHPNPMHDQPSAPSQNFVWILLAAGASTRLGQSKQLLHLGGKALVTHQIETLLHTQCDVCVISGAIDLQGEVDQCLVANKFSAMLTLIHNPQWQQGMASSIRLAIKSFPNRHLGFVLVDQYALTNQSILGIYRQWRHNDRQVCVSQYDKTKPNAWGAPVIVPNHILQEAQTISPDQGLKPWLISQAHILDINYYWWPQAQYDIDTPSQWQQLSLQESWHDHTKH